VVSFLQISWLKFYMHFSSSPWVLRAPRISSSISVWTINLKIFKGFKYFEPHFLVLRREVIVKRVTTCPHRDIHTHTWTSPNGVTHNQIDNVLIEKRQHSKNILHNGVSK
jgi:hypothetical protein